MLGGIQTHLVYAWCNILLSMADERLSKRQTRHNPLDPVLLLVLALWYVVKDLTLKVSTLDGTSTIRTSGPEITIASRWYHLPTAESPLGSYGEPQHYPEITRGKDGGSRD